MRRETGHEAVDAKSAGGIGLHSMGARDYYRVAQRCAIEREHATGQSRP